MTAEEFLQLCKDTYIVAAGDAFYVFLPDATHNAGTYTALFGTLSAENAVLVFPNCGQADGQTFGYVKNTTHYYTSSKHLTYPSIYLYTNINLTYTAGSGYKNFKHGVPIRPVPA
ncbi:MAG: hypothetical protein KBT32_11590 [Bacteroidales bacterium]|nr:hypothetical protein [Candidatus Physcocola equi]